MKDERKIRSTYADRDNALLDLGAMGYRAMAGSTTHYTKGMCGDSIATLTADGNYWIVTRELA